MEEFNAETEIDFFEPRSVGTKVLERVPTPSS
jgi:hypothetical protein